ncbi:MAG: gamma-butyrobetaine hydroxylase-like domain-containing protein [Pseudomonadota bacterium]
MTERPWPTELRVPPARNQVRVTYDDGQQIELGAEYLRVFTPSAERKGHGARQVIGGKAAVTIKEIAAVGRYAVRIVFDDGHATGIYPLHSLMDLAKGYSTNWSAYERELAVTGLSRDRPGTAPAPAGDAVGTPS